MMVENFVGRWLLSMGWMWMQECIGKGDRRYLKYSRLASVSHVACTKPELDHNS